jgi:hypothetical protein
MATKQDFTAEEWTKILESIMLAGMAVSAADPNGLWGMTKEALASRSALTAYKRDVGSNELVKAVIADFETKEGRTTLQEALLQLVAGANLPDIVQRSLDNLREVSAIIDAKAPKDAAAFKALLLGVSQEVAQAAVEGGVLGFGGVLVSDAETATLKDIAKALGTTT